LKENARELNLAIALRAPALYEQLIEKILGVLAPASANWAAFPF
jgi:hypothetical protein